MSRALRFPHLAIRASAGAGKTHRLTSRFIALLATDELPDRVLATTFTRKAAGEILERILQRLAAAARDPHHCQRLGVDIDRSLSPARACELVGTLARNLHRLHARTLDSFFARVARSYAIELDLPPDWQIIDESRDAALRSAAIHATIRNGDPRELSELVRLVSRGDASRSVAERIGRLVVALHAMYCETDSAAWNCIPRPTRRKQDHVDAALAALEKIELPRTKQGKENGNWRKALTAATTFARVEDWDRFVENGLVAAALTDSSYYSTPVPSPVCEALGPLIDQARAVIVGRLADRCRASHQLLAEFDTHYRRLQRAERGLRFEDVTHGLARSAMIQQFREIYFRLDAEVSHLLLDEFQDTSLLQWEVVRPLAQEINAYADDSHSFFCVGDVKQAIYGWRGGVAEIFGSLGTDLRSLTWEPIVESRRSAPIIIDVVNRVFSNLDRNAALVNYRDAATAWSAGFEEHRTVHTEMPGYVRLSVAPRATNGEKQTEQTLVFVADEIARIRELAPGRSIGVLVRKNKAIGRLIYELRQRGVHASEEGGNPLTDTPAVTVVLSLLKLADHPGDTVARFHVATSPLGPLVGLTQTNPKRQRGPHNDANDQTAERLAAIVRRSLLQHGYGSTIWQWVNQLTSAGACDDRDLDRLGQLVELAHRYEPSATLRPGDFVAYVESTPVEDPVPATVRVMTIHKAKGLQFDVVVLPDLDGKLLGQRPPVVIGRPSPISRVNLVCPYVSESVRELLPPELRRPFADWQNQAVRGELCVLYVALTRAVSAMHLIVAPSGEKEKGLPPTFAGILRDALAPGMRLEPSTVAYEHGDAAWHSAPSADRSHHAPRDESGPVISDVAELSADFTRSVQATLVSPAPTHAVRGLTRESPSGLEGGDRVDLRKRLRLGNAAALDRGSLFHAWFERIEWLDAEPDDATLRDAARRTGVRCENLDDMIFEYRAMLRQPAIRAALARPTSPRGASFEVWRERPFVIRTADTLLAGKFDRVVVTLESSQVVRADVVDFKSDALVADDRGHTDAVVAHYRPQIDAYRIAVSRLLNIRPTSVGAKLIFVTAGVVADL
jgi:ATP-dependent exoDNAse (exonuclease V) beta subunit